MSFTAYVHFFVYKRCGYYTKNTRKGKFQNISQRLSGRTRTKTHEFK